MVCFCFSSTPSACRLLLSIILSSPVNHSVYLPGPPHHATQHPSNYATGDPIWILYSARDHLKSSGYHATRGAILNYLDTMLHMGSSQIIWIQYSARDHLKSSGYNATRGATSNHLDTIPRRGPSQMIRLMGTISTNVSDTGFLHYPQPQQFVSIF